MIWKRLNKISFVPTNETRFFCARKALFFLRGGWLSAAVFVLEAYSINCICVCYGNVLLQFHRKLEIHGTLEVNVLKDKFEEYFWGEKDDATAATLPIRSSCSDWQKMFLYLSYFQVFFFSSFIIIQSIAIWLTRVIKIFFFALYFFVRRKKRQQNKFH